MVFFYNAITDWNALPLWVNEIISKQKKKIEKNCKIFLVYKCKTDYMTACPIQFLS